MKAIYQEHRDGHTPVNDLIFVAPVNSFDQLKDVASYFIRWRTIRQLLQQLKHILKNTAKHKQETINMSSELQFRPLQMNKKVKEAF